MQPTQRDLPGEPDDVESGAAPPLPSLQSNFRHGGGITGEWWSDLDRAWWGEVHGKARALVVRARRAREREAHASARARDPGIDPQLALGWGRVATAQRERVARLEARARSLAESREERVGTCGNSAMTVSCKCGPRRVVVGCGQRWLCDACRSRYYQTIRRVSLRSWRTRWQERHDQWRAAGRRAGSAWRYYFIRLSVAHSGDVGADRERILRGWTEAREWIWRAIGREHPYYLDVNATTGRRKQGASFPFQLTWEATAGTDGLGHVHAHVVVLWPWFDWQGLHRVWVQATEDQSNHVRIEAVRAGSGAQTEHARARDAVVAVADYVAKYASKGVTLETFDGALAGRTLAAFYCKRVVSASRGFLFYEPCRCRECGCAFDLREPPEARRVALAQMSRRIAAAPRASPYEWPAPVLRMGDVSRVFGARDAV